MNAEYIECPYCGEEVEIGHVWYYPDKAKSCEHCFEYELKGRTTRKRRKPYTQAEKNLYMEKERAKVLAKYKI
jgi:hypothetical protein